MLKNNISQLNSYFYKETGTYYLVVSEVIEVLAKLKGEESCKEVEALYNKFKLTSTVKKMLKFHSIKLKKEYQAVMGITVSKKPKVAEGILLNVGVFDKFIKAFSCYVNLSNYWDYSCLIDKTTFKIIDIKTQHCFGTDIIMDKGFMSLYIVYRFISKENEVIYIGKSKCVVQRFQGHTHLPHKCYEEINKVQVMCFETEGGNGYL